MRRPKTADRWTNRERLTLRAIEPRRVEPVICAHPAQDNLLPMVRCLGCHVWIQFARILRKTGQKRSFRVTQIGHWLVEIIISRGGQTDVQISKINPVEISGENLIFRPELFETKGSRAFD